MEWVDGWEGGGGWVMSPRRALTSCYDITITVVVTATAATATTTTTTTATTAVIVAVVLTTAAAAVAGGGVFSVLHLFLSLLRQLEVARLEQ